MNDWHHQYTSVVLFGATLVNDNLPVELAERIKSITDSPQLIDAICAHVTNGGTLITLCQAWKVRYSDIAKWIHTDPERDEMYRNALNDRNEWAKETLLHELRQIGTVDIREMFDEDGAVKPIHEWPEALGKCVAAVEVFEEFAGRGADREMVGYTKRVKFWDKLRAIELLGKNAQMFIDRVEHSGLVKLEDLVLGSTKLKPSAATRETVASVNPEEIRNGHKETVTKKEAQEDEGLLSEQAEIGNLRPSPFDGAGGDEVQIDPNEPGSAPQA